MERIFETQSAGYGQMVLGIARATKTKVSGDFTALKLPKFLVSMLTWGVLISLGSMLAGLIAVVALIYFALTVEVETRRQNNWLRSCEKKVDRKLWLDGNTICT